MKKVIAKKLYDTRTATLIAEHSNHLGYSDFKWYEEELYRTKNGSWFMYGQGGPLSRYCKPSGSNGWQEGRDIVPMDTEEVIEWLSEHDENDIIDEYFSEHVVEA